MNRNAVFAVCAAIMSGCASRLPFAEGRTGSVALPGFEPRKGGHCESSAMLNALAYLDYGVTEADIIGGGGAPAFLFANEGFPFIGSRNERMRESFLAAAKIPYRAVVPEGDDDGWDRIVALLDRGIPVLLRVDMRWLPYLYGGKYGSARMSFGWHWICLYGIEFGAREVLVTDTERGGPCRIALADLDKARSSATKVYPPRREYAWIEPKPAGWALDPDALARAAFREILANYDAPAAWTDGGGPAPARGRRTPLVGLSGLAAFPEALAALHSSVSPYALGAAYSFMADTIERNGTGGAAFRRLFRDFLAARSADCADASARDACAALVLKAEAAMAAWSALADAFYRASASIQTARGGTAREAAIAAVEASTAERARALYAAELALRDAIAAR